MTRALLTRLPVLGFFAALVIRQLLIPPIDRIRQEAPGLIDSLPASDPSRMLLDRYHRLSTGFFSLEIAAALLMLISTSSLLSARRAAPPAPEKPKEVVKVWGSSRARAALGPAPRAPAAVRLGLDRRPITLALRTRDAARPHRPESRAATGRSAEPRPWITRTRPTTRQCRVARLRRPAASRTTPGPIPGTRVEGRRRSSVRPRSMPGGEEEPGAEPEKDRRPARHPVARAARAGETRRRGRAGRRRNDRPLEAAESPRT